MHCLFFFAPLAAWHYRGYFYFLWDRTQKQVFFLLSVPDVLSLCSCSALLFLFHPRACRQASNAQQGTGILLTHIKGRNFSHSIWHQFLVRSTRRCKLAKKKVLYHLNIFHIQVCASFPVTPVFYAHRNIWKHNLNAWMSPRGGCVEWNDMDRGAVQGGDW